MKRYAIAVLTVLFLAVGVGEAQKTPKPKTIKPGFNLFSKEQDVQLGQEYAKQVEQQMAVVTDADINAFVQRIGKRLAQAPEADKYPYSFKVVQEESINAFALPGGPTFTHTGLITQADNEAQVAGVLAHEIAHVALRHGTNQASKAQFLQLAAMMGGQLAGGGITGTLAQLGIGLGANSVLMKFSRNAETQADLLGTRMMHQAGYNPIELARFFEKLQAQHGKQNKLVEMFMSSHPNPGNRVKAVQDEMRLLPQRTYDGESGDIARIKQRIGAMPELPKPKQGALPAGGDPKNVGAARPSGKFKTLQNQAIAFEHPDNWEVFPSQDGSQMTVAPRAGIIGESISYGLIASFFPTEQTDFSRATDELAANLLKGNEGMRIVQKGRVFTLNGNRAMATRLEGKSAFEGTTESDVLLTVQRQGALFYMVLIAPTSDLQTAMPSFDRIIQSVRFAN